MKVSGRDPLEFQNSGVLKTHGSDLIKFFSSEFISLSS